MRILNKYIGLNLLYTMLMSLGVLLFVMFSGHFFRSFELLRRGVPPGVLAEFLLYMIPDIIPFALPISMLVATVLVFGRMSSDNEISALKAGGINLWQIVAPGLALSLACCVMCLYVSLYVRPICRNEAEKLKWSALAKAPVTMLEPGVFLALSDTCQISVSGHDDNGLKGVHLLLREEGDVLRDVTAEHGSLDANFENRSLTIMLENATVTEFTFRKSDDGKDIERSDCRMTTRHETFNVPLDYGKDYDGARLVPRTRYMTLPDLFGFMRLVKPEGEGHPMTELLLELHWRLSWAVAPISFFLLGLPFGIRGKRSELSVGLLMCVLLGMIFYAFIMLAEMLDQTPDAHPELVVWVPNVLYMIGGYCAIHRMGRH